MSNLEEKPTETVCSTGPGSGPGSGRAVEVLEPRDVPLGGPRSMSVRRTLPQRQRSLIGAWCFLDHYGPDDVAATGGMSVAPHPHTGLQTVSWLFTGEVEHRDSIGTHAVVRPGELNLMTAGHGISHSEVSTPATTVLHGAQLWVALPASDRDVDPEFAHHAPAPVTGPGWEARVFLGSLLGVTSPVAVHSPLVGAELLVQPGTTLDLAVDPTYEHGLLVDSGHLVLEGHDVGAHHLAYVGVGADTLRLVSGGEPGDGPTRLLLIGGEPLGESIVMWWNFVGRTHEDVLAARADWQGQIGPDGLLEGRFGVPVADPLPPIPAPPLPNVRLKGRG